MREAKYVADLVRERPLARALSDDRGWLRGSKGGAAVEGRRQAVRRSIHRRNEINHDISRTGEVAVCAEPQLVRGLSLTGRTGADIEYRLRRRARCGYDG